MAVAGVLVTLLSVLGVALKEPFLSGDSQALAKGTDRVLQCLRESKFTNCEPSPQDLASEKDLTAVTQFPVLQYLPGLMLRVIGLSDDGISRGLIAINALSFIATVVLLCWAAASMANPLGGQVLVLLMITSPLAWYGTAAFGEMLAALAIAAYCALLLRRGCWLLVAASLVIAGISKETVLPFLLAIGIIPLLASECKNRTVRRQHIVALALGSSGALALNSAFNYFRYGQGGNRVYSQDILQVREFDTWAKSFVALWLAPNGGLVWFWPSLCSLLAVLAIVAWGKFRQGRRDWRFYLPAFAIIGMLVVMTAGLALWFAPFGWVAWGPRLSLPLLPGIALIIVTYYAELLREMVRFVSRSWFILLVLGGVVAVVSLPQLLILWSPEAVGALFAPDSVCPVTPVIEQNRSYFFRCQDHYAWTRPSVLVSGVQGLRSGEARLVAAAYGVAVLGLFCTMKGAAARKGPNNGSAVRRCSCGPEVMTPGRHTGRR
jgi:hypothetical protein